MNDPSDHDATVLVVDDEHDTAERIRDTLRSEGLHTQVAHHGRQALGAKRYRSEPFDLRALIAEVRRHLGTQAPESRRASL